MKIQFKNASLVSVTNGSVVIKNYAGRKQTFTNASVISVNNGTIVIETEWEPKEGELIKVEENGKKFYVIVKTSKDFILHDYGFFNGYRISTTFCGWDIKNINISPVTPEEQKEFDDFCKSQGKIWNKETLQWEKYRWKPIIGESYFSITTSYAATSIIETTWNNDQLDQSTYNYGNYFKTKEEAEIKLNEIKNIFKE